MLARHDACPFEFNPANPGASRAGRPVSLSGSLAAAAALLAALVGTLSAPVARAEESTFRSPAQAGAWAMQFRVSHDFQLSSFNGTIVSLKRHSSPGTAIRVGVSGDISLFNYSEEWKLPDPDIIDFPSDRERDRYSILLNFQRLKYTRPAERMSLYWGIGPTVGFSRADEERIQYREQTTPETEYTLFTLGVTSTRWSAGLDASLGVEWFATRHLGLHAEYGLTASYEWIGETQTREYPENTRTFSVDLDGFHLGGSGVLFGLSAYF